MWHFRIITHEFSGKSLSIIPSYELPLCISFSIVTGGASTESKMGGTPDEPPFWTFQFSGTKKDGAGSQLTDRSSFLAGRLSQSRVTKASSHTATRHVKLISTQTSEPTCNVTGGKAGFKGFWGTESEPKLNRTRTESEPNSNRIRTELEPNILNSREQRGCVGVLGNRFGN